MHISKYELINAWKRSAASYRKATTVAFLGCRDMSWSFGSPKAPINLYNGLDIQGVMSDDGPQFGTIGRFGDLTTYIEVLIVSPEISDYS